MSLRKICTLGLAMVLSATAAQAKKRPSLSLPCPLHPQQAALVQRAIEREQATVKTDPEEHAGRTDLHPEHAARPQALRRPGQR